MKTKKTILKADAKSCVQQFNVGESGSQTYLVYLPGGWSKKSKVLVCVHGISRKHKEQISGFKKDAAKNDTILVAPHFNDKVHRSYQRHEKGSDGLRSDQVLDHIMADVSARFAIDIPKFDLFGYSGGAQFAHRYAFRHPHRIARLTTCAAGWYTIPDFNVQFPYGLASDQQRGIDFHVSEDQLREFLSMPITVAVGEYDIRLGPSLNRSKIVNANQGYSRLERAVNWTRLLIEAAEARHIQSQIKFVLIPRSGHSFFECINYGTLSRFLFE